MKLAVISPINLLERCSTDFHLVLTQYYLSSPAYRDFFLERRKHGDRIILDNGAAELKRAVDGLDLIDVAKELRPNIVVAPDVIYDVNQTMRLTDMFLFKHASELRRLGALIMAVPQGATPKLWRLCFDEFNRDDRVDWLGISMFYTPKFSRRLKVLKSIADVVRKPCHLLGVWDNPHDLLEEKDFDFVKSVDTAKMIEFALEGLGLKDWMRHKHIDDDYYFTLDSLLCSLRMPMIEKNIQEMKEIVA